MVIVDSTFGWRTHRSSIRASIVLGLDDVLIWGGNQADLPLVHDNEENKSFTTRLDLRNLPSMEWNNVSTTGTPPAGAMEYRATTIDELEMYVCMMLVLTIKYHATCTTTTE